MQTAGHRVGVGVELAAGVQLGHDDLDGGDTGGVHPDRDATAVVDDLDATVGEQGDLDLGGVAGHGLVDGVVDDLPDQVVQAALTGGTDVHARALANRLESLEDGDGGSAVVLASEVLLSDFWAATGG